MRFDASAFVSASSNSSPVSRHNVSRYERVGHRLIACLPFVWIALQRGLSSISWRFFIPNRVPAMADPEALNGARRYLL